MPHPSPLSIRARRAFGISLLALISHQSHASETAAEATARRDVTLTTTATITEIPQGATAIDLWLPVAQDTDGQTVSRVEVVYPQGGAIAAEARYGNKMWHKRFESPFTADLHEGTLGVRIVFDIHRTEINVAEAKSLAPLPKVKPATTTYLEPNTLIPIDYDPVKKIAADLKLDGDPPIVAAHKVYDWLIDEFKYDWKAPGAGRGDVRWACDAKTGDCGDYHSTFLAVCRLEGIPADHEFGYPIRAKAREGMIPSYHCWARFQVAGLGWIPIDASEADKHPELRAYNFGSQSADLMKFTHGRDVTLAPPQAGPPLNKFIHPYVEVDGKPYEKVKLAVTFKDLAVP